MPIINKKYGLCTGCNWERINGGSYAEHLLNQQKVNMARMQQKAALKQRNKTFKPSKPIKQQTAKEGAIKSALSRIKRELDLEAIQDGEYFCKGCGRSYNGLDKSHILSVGMYKHLELVKENIQLMCRQGSPYSAAGLGCHQIWESGTIEQKVKLLCFESNLQIMKVLDLNAFNKLNNEYERHQTNYFLN